MSSLSQNPGSARRQVQEFAGFPAGAERQESLPSALGPQADAALRAHLLQTHGEVEAAAQIFKGLEQRK